MTAGRVEPDAWCRPLCVSAARGSARAVRKRTYGTSGMGGVRSLAPAAPEGPLLAPVGRSKRPLSGRSRSVCFQPRKPTAGFEPLRTGDHAATVWKRREEDRDNAQDVSRSDCLTRLNARIRPGNHTHWRLLLRSLAIVRSSASVSLDPAGRTARRSVHLDATPRCPG